MVLEGPPRGPLFQRLTLKMGTAILAESDCIRGVDARDWIIGSQRTRKTVTNL